MTQVLNIFAALHHGGRHLCSTPSRLLGSADISKYFEDEVASGFHLGGYSARELRDALRGAGFASVHAPVSRGRASAVPLTADA